VAFEGIDGSGKSTLAKAVARRLKSRGLPVVLTQEPTTSAIGRLVRRGIRDKYDAIVQAGLFLSDRAWHVLQLTPHLLRRDIVLTDRYADSTTAYQSAALDGRLPDALRTLDGVQSTVFPRPDLVVWLDLAPREALKRIQKRAVKEPYEKERFLQRVRANYRTLAKRDPKRWLVLDATLPAKELAAIVGDAIVSVHEERKRRAAESA
jgi:dTMP kinase